MGRSIPQPLLSPSWAAITSASDRGCPETISHGTAAYSKVNAVPSSVAPWGWTNTNTTTLAAMSRIVTHGRRLVGLLSRRGITGSRYRRHRG